MHYQHHIMELRQLRTFIKIAETLNFSEASKALNATQSTLSQQIKQLEEEFKTKLFNRNSHSVSLTEAGAELLPFAIETIRYANDCSERMRDLQNVLVGNLNIGVTYSFSPILSETIFSFMKEFKGIKLNIYYKPMSELMVMLRQRQVDFVLAFKPSYPMPDIESHFIFQNYLAAIVNSNSSLAKLSKISMDELANYNLALPSKGLQARNAFDKMLEKQPHKMNVQIQLNDPNILLNLVKTGNMVTILAEASVYNQTGIKAIPIDFPNNEMTGCVHTLRDSYHKKSMQEFIKLLGESIAVKERANAWL